MSEQLQPAQFSRVALKFWGGIIVLASIALILSWPEAQKHNCIVVGDWTDKVLELPDGTEVVPLADYETVLARLQVFERRRFFTTYFSGVIAAAITYLTACRLTGRDMSPVTAFIAFLCSTCAMACTERWLPPVVELLIGEGKLYLFSARMEYIIYTLFPIALSAAIINSILFVMRWLVRKALCRSLTWKAT
jgi:hypothetical protein